MDKLTKNFQSGEVLKAQDLNNVKDKVNELVENVNTGGSEGGDSIAVDSSLSTTSINPVQNKVITAELNKRTTYSNSEIDDELAKKVDVADGKGLSTNDYSTTEKNKLATLKNYEADIKAINTKVDILSDVSAAKVSLRSENPAGEFEYSNDGGVITQPIYKRAVRVSGLPKVSGESKSVAFSPETLGNGLYFVVDNVSIADISGVIASSFLVKYRFEVEVTGGTSSIKATALETVTADLTAIVQVSYIKNNAIKTTVVLNCTSEEEANNLTLTIPHTKFDKQPFSVTLDDANTSHYCVSHLGINNRQISAGTSGFMHANQFKAGDLPDTISPAIGHTLCFTDGCGNDRRFAFGCAVWPNSSSNNQVMMDTVNPIDPTANNQYRFMNPHLQWGDIKEMIKFGHSTTEHNVNQDMYGSTDPEKIKQGFLEDCATTIDRIGRGLKMMTQPDGNQKYTEAFESYDSLLLDVSQRYGVVKPFTDSFSLYKAKCYRAFPDPSSSYLTDIAAEMSKDRKERTWIHLGQHRTGMDFITDFLVPIYNLYGKAGADNIWFASTDEIYEYWFMRKHARIKKTVNGTKATFEIYFPIGQYFYYPELTFIPSSGNFSIDSLSDNIVGFSINSAKTMFNINLNQSLPTLAEECVAQYESTLNNTDKDDAIYFVNQLKSGAIKDAFNARINAVEEPIVIAGLTITSKPSTIIDYVQLSVSYTPDNTTQKGVTWSSSDTSVATVDSTGIVTAIKAGSVTITATSSANKSISDSFTATCSVTQSVIPVTALQITGNNNVNVGDNLQLSVSYTPDNTTQKGVTWSSSDTSVATVDSTGIVTAIKAGSATITATSKINNSISATKSITIAEVIAGNPTVMLAEYSWTEYKIDHLLDPTANKYLTLINSNGNAPISNNMYDSDTGESLWGWGIMSVAGKDAYYGVLTTENWLGATGMNGTNPDYSTQITYNYSYKYNGATHPILGWHVPNGSYKVSILSYCSGTYNLKDGHLELNKVEQTLPDLSMYNNRIWVDFPAIDVTDGKIVLRMWGNTSKNVGLCIVKIEKIK